MPESASPDAPGPDTSPAFTALHVRVMMRLWGWLPWLVVAFLIYLSIVLGAAVRRRVAAKEAGAVKPVLAPAAGEVTAVHQSARSGTFGGSSRWSVDPAWHLHPGIASPGMFQSPPGGIRHVRVS